MALIEKNLLGKEVLDNYDYIYPFKEGLARVKKNGWYNFINKDGEKLMELSLFNCKDFKEGLAAVCLNGVYGFINKEGKMVIKPSFYKVSSFSEGMAAFMNYKNSTNNSIFMEEVWGFINKEGKIIVESKYKEVGKFSDGFAKVLSDTGWGFINKEGEEVIEPIYKGVCAFKNGVGGILKEDGWHFINKEGKIVSKRSYCDISNDEKKDYIVFKHNEKWFIADPNNLTYEVSIELEDKKLKRHFYSEKEADKFIEIISAYIEERLIRKESEENEIKRKIESLIKEEEKNILKINESYVEDVEKEFNSCYKKSIN